jgi:hypothetical protein
MLEEIVGEGVASEQGKEQPRAPEAPPPWSSWEELRRIRNLLWDVRYLILRRPEHLTEKDREKLGILFESPVGEEVRLLRGFLEESGTRSSTPSSADAGAPSKKRRNVTIA